MNVYTVMCIDYSTFTFIQVQDIVANDEEEAKKIAIERSADRGQNVKVAPDMPNVKAVIRIK